MEINVKVMIKFKEGFIACLEAKKWSGKVKVEKEEKPKEGTFTKSADSIVKELMRKAEGNAGTAMKKLNFYMNRAGDSVSNKAELNKAKSILSKKLENKKEK